jgi:hypothetical protein
MNSRQFVAVALELKRQALDPSFASEQLDDKPSAFCSITFGEVVVRLTIFNSLLACEN